MYSRTSRLTIVMIVLSLICLGSGPVSAKSEIVPGGPWLSDNQTVNLNAFSSYDELVKSLKQIEKASKGLVEIKGGIGQKSNGMLVKHAQEQMMAILEATADGSLYMADPDRVIELDIGRTFYYKQIPADGNADEAETE